MEPSYQVYIDNISISAGTPSFNITFPIISNGDVFSASAYGPDNQALGVNITYPSSSYASVVVSTQNLTSFSLVTILDGTTYLYGNYTTYLDFYPTTNSNITTTSTTYLPEGAQYLFYNYTQGNFSSSTSGTRTVLSGTGTSFINSTSGTVTYGGNYQQLEVSSLNRLFEIGTSNILVQDTITFNVTGLSFYPYFEYSLSTININTPPGATGISVGDTIGTLSYVQNNNGTITVTLRNSIISNEVVEFTLYYSLPLSSMVTSDNGRAVFSSAVSPSWLNYPVRGSAVIILMPLGSSDPQMAGAQTLTYNGHLAAMASFGPSIITYVNPSYSLSYVPSLIGPYLLLIIIIVLVVIAIVSYVIYRLVWKKRRAQRGAGQASPAAKPQQNPSK